MIFLFELISSSIQFSFLLIEWFSKFTLFMHMRMQYHDKCRSYMFLTKRKACQIYKVCVWSVEFIPLVSSNETILRNHS
jgi:hypothetical protein